MKIRIRWPAIVTMTAAGGLLALGACSDDEKVGASETADASPGDARVTDSDSGPGQTVDASDGSVDTSGLVTFTIPAAGGSVNVQGGATALAFTFPASAAGKTITLKPGSATDIGWPAGQFADVIEMGPDGERFADPIIVRPAKKELVAALLSFSETGMSKGPASPLPLNAAGDGFELRHFTSLVIVPPGKLCDSEGHSDTPDAGKCGDAGSATTLRQITCKGYSYCVLIEGACCVDPSVDSGTGCSLEQQRFGVSYKPTDSNGGSQPHCEVDAGDWDGGPTNCQGNLNYAFAANGGCSVTRDCGPFYSMTCNGTTCTCQKGAQSATFTQTAACDTTATMRTAYVQKCNFPVNKTLLQ